MSRRSALRRGQVIGSATIAAPVTPAPVYTGPFVITAGGVYTGNWESTADPTVPAVTINTSDPVTLLNCRIRGKGDLISSYYQGANLIVRGCQGLGLNPGVTSRFQGRFAQIEGFLSMLIEDNVIAGTSGMYLNGITYSGQATTITVRRNRATNIDGRYSDGAGGYQNTKYSAQFLQLNHINNTPNVDVSWNRVENTPGQSAPEDVININNSSGTSASWIDVHHNLIVGAYAAVPTSSFSGGGIMLGDGGGQFEKARSNTVIETSNYGIAVSNGNDMLIDGNTVLQTGRLPDGTVHNTTPDNGIYLRDYAADPAHRPASVIASNNTVGFGHPNPGDPGNRLDLNVSAAGTDGGGNTHVSPNPGEVSPSVITAAINAWTSARAAL